MEKRLQPQQVGCHISNVQIQPTVLEYLGFRVSQNSLSGVLQDNICPSYLISSSFIPNGVNIIFEKMTSIGLGMVLS